MQTVWCISKINSRLFINISSKIRFNLWLKPILYLCEMNVSFNNIIEKHPLQPFISPKVEVMMIGSFPPARTKWNMEFYYPNFQNDMWRIFGLVFFDCKDYFLVDDKKSFDINLLKSTLTDKGIGIADMGQEVTRLKNNASDKFLQIDKPLNLSEILYQIPLCNNFITAGEKATETLRVHFSDKIKHPPVGGCESFNYLERDFTIYRMPSSSRAYPMPLIKKAEIYKQCFKDIGLL